METKKYEPGCSGFVVEHRYEMEHKRTGETVERSTWWMGPRSWCIGYSDLADAAVFASRPAARKAFERAGGTWRDGHRAERVTDVEARLTAAGQIFAPTLKCNDGTLAMYRWTTPEYAVA
jgi:hypothetical protein